MTLGVIRSTSVTTYLNLIFCPKFGWFIDALSKNFCFIFHYYTIIFISDNLQFLAFLLEIYTYFFRYFFIILISNCLWRCSNFCNSISNFITNQITSCFCYFLNNFFEVVLYLLQTWLVWSRSFRLYFSGKSLLMFLPIFLPIFLAKDKNP